jgi:Glycosyl transferase 4-like domain
MGNSLKNILYVASGRGVSGKDPGRKITAILSCWRGYGHNVRAIFGCEIASPVEPATADQDFGHENYHRKWYRKSRLLEPLVHTASEWKDIRHSRAAQRSLGRLLSDEYRPDLVWERSYRLLSPGLDLAQRLGVPFVLEWKDHLIDYRQSLFRSQALRMEARKLREADYIVVESGVQKTRRGTRTAQRLGDHETRRPDVRGSGYPQCPGYRGSTRIDRHHMPN